MLPLITTIIPTYRRPQQLKKAIRSALDQTYPYLQVCVYDNASNDETSLIVAEIAATDARVKYYCHTENIGAFKNFQFGLKNVQTKFFSFLSDDDYLLPDFYQTALSGFEKYSDSIMSITDVIYLGGNCNVVNMALEKWMPGYYTPQAGLASVLRNGHSAWTGILFKTEVTDIVGYLDEDTGAFSDLDYTLRVAGCCPYVVSKTPGAVFVQSTSLKRAPYSFDLIWPGVLNMISNLTGDSKINSDIKILAEHTILEDFSKNHFKLVLAYLSHNNIDDAEKAALVFVNHFKKPLQYIIATSLIKSVKHSSFMRSIFNLLVACRRWIILYRLQLNQSKYNEIRKLLIS